MAISRELIVTVKEDTSLVNENIFVYENDRGIDLFFTIKESKYKYVKDGGMLKGMTNAVANITVVKPNNEEISVVSTVENEKVRFTITEDLTDEISEIGIYKLQFHIGDGDCCEFSIPPISFEVKERLKGIKENGTVDNAKVDIDTVAEELFNIIDGKIVLVWKSGDLITAKKLNDMVNSINNKSNLEHTHNELHIHSNKVTIDKLTDIKIQEWDSKSDFNGDYNSLNNKPNIPSIDGLASEIYVNNKIASKVDKTEGKGLSSNDFTNTYKTKLDNLNNYTHPNDSNTRHVSDIDKSRWDNKSDFDGNYNSLVGLPSIPNVDVDKNYVDLELRKKSNTNHSHNELHTHNNKEVIDAITNAKINEWNGKSNFDGNYNSLTNKPSIATKTSQLANDSKFTNEDFVTNKIAEASLGGGEIDLSGYATKEDLSKKSDNTHNHNDSYASKSSEHTHSNKTSLDKVTETKISSWDNKSNFSGNYSDLSGKPNIPSINGLATETFVNNGLSGKANSEHIHSKSSITDFAHRHDASEIDNLPSGGNNSNVIPRVTKTPLLDEIFVSQSDKSEFTLSSKIIEIDDKNNFNSVLDGGSVTATITKSGMLVINVTTLGSRYYMIKITTGGRTESSAWLNKIDKLVYEVNIGDTIEFYVEDTSTGYRGNFEGVAKNSLTWNSSLGEVDLSTNSSSGASVIVVDNLTSESTTNALSAKQGKVLDNKITVLNVGMTDVEDKILILDNVMYSHAHSYSTLTDKPNIPDQYNDSEIKRRISELEGFNTKLEQIRNGVI